MRARRRRRHELFNIASLGDVNELSISGHVEHQPVLSQDEDGVTVYEFVLTHTTSQRYGHGWEHQRYNVTAYHALGEHYAASWQPGHTIIIDGHLEYDVCDTLAGPITQVSVVAHSIDTALGPHPHIREHQRTGG
jgi:single-stranded DNA-binding protein